MTVTRHADVSHRRDPGTNAARGYVWVNDEIGGRVVDLHDAGGNAAQMVDVTLFDRESEFGPVDGAVDATAELVAFFDLHER